MTGNAGKKYAAALKYRPQTGRAPEVVAKGGGKIAEKIISLAKAHDLYIHEDPDLVEVLSRLDIGDEIPPELYVVVAEIMAFVYGVNGGKNIR